MSYENPKQIDYAQRSLAISQGLGNLFSGTFDTLNKTIAAYAKEKAEANAIINKSGAAAKAEYSKAYLTTQAAADKFTGGLGTKDPETGEYKKSSDAPMFKEQITAILVNIGDKLNADITKIQESGGGVDQINAARNESILRMNALAQDMTNWDLARAEYMAAKDLAPNQVGALLPNQKNSGLIKMFDAATDDEKGNLFITEDPDGHFRVSLGKMEGDKFDVETTLDMTNWTADQQGKGTFFQEVTEFSEKQYKPLKNLMKDLKKDKRFADKAGYLDKEAVKDYLLNDNLGRSLMNNYIDEEDKHGHWRMIADQDVTDWAAYDETYTDDLFLDKIINNVLSFEEDAPKRKKSVGKEEGEVEEIGNKTELEIAYDYNELQKDLAKEKAENAKKTIRLIR